MSSPYAEFPENTKLESIEDLIALAAFVEQMIASEQAWIMNRLHWLFTSQSFLIAAFIALVVTTPPVSEKPIVKMATVTLPLVGLIFCILVAGAIHAAGRVAMGLCNQRARLTEVINAHCVTDIPLVGASFELRRPYYWTFIVGSLPHNVLPWVLALFWILSLTFALFCR
jgi:hypothetical protein